MSRRIVPGSAPQGFSIMYYALCLMILALIAIVLWPVYAPSVNNPLEILKYALYAYIGTKVLFVIGGFMVVGVAGQSGLGFLHYISLAIWTLSAGLDVLQVTSTEFLLKTPVWLEKVRGVGSLFAIVASLFFLRNLADEINSTPLIARSKNTLQIGIFMILVYAATYALSVAEVKLEGGLALVLGLVILIGTIVAFVMYANLLMATGRELDKPQSAPEA